MTRYIQNPYLVLLERFSKRRKGFLHKRMPHTALWAISSPADDPTCLWIESASNFLASARATHCQPPLAKVYADGRILFYPPHAAYLPHSIRSIFQYLTDDVLTIFRNPSRKTSATHLVAYQMHWSAKGYMMAGWSKPGPWIDAHRDQMTRNVPISGGVELQYPYSVTNCRSLEPIGVRQWVPEKRREYLRLRREMRKQTQLRALVGALDPVLQDAPKDFALFNYAADMRSKWRELIAHGELSAEKHETYKLLASASLSQLDWRLKMRLTQHGGTVSHEELIEAMNGVIHNDSELLRLKTGAVVYNLESVSPNSQDDQNVVVQSPDNLRAVPPAS